MQYFTQSLTFASIVSGTATGSFLGKGGLFKRDSCDTACMSAADLMDDQCGSEIDVDFESTTKLLTCMCNMQDPFWKSLSNCVRFCPYYEGLNGDTSPQGLHNGFCRAADTYSSVLEEYSGTIPWSIQEAMEGMGFGVASAEGQVEPGTNIEATTTLETNLKTKALSNAKATHNILKTTETSTVESISETLTSVNRKLSSSLSTSSIKAATPSSTLIINSKKSTSNSPEFFQFKNSESQASQTINPSITQGSGNLALKLEPGTILYAFLAALL
ncbi:uncharacterized protein J8A68_004411 [[Candida] subhashii]|uniref:Uncharacterized protein n=1 Tax=[Candida] subhashii TaxID=561895 RepID=A0A8J5QH57_9ASCO|nr:uncharacterized protein J8A68_004411 [[Candida] subhashii]KAG7662023.1 hypothetical protein J8A68_004411 [[Candida] subhashii]